MCFYPGVKPDPPPPACEGGEAWGTLKVPGEGWTIGEGNTRGGEGGQVTRIGTKGL